MTTHFSEVLNKERPRSRRHKGFEELAGELTKFGVREGVLSKRKGRVEPKSSNRHRIHLQHRLPLSTLSWRRRFLLIDLLMQLQL